MITNGIAVLFILGLLVVVSVWLEQNNKHFKKLGSAALVILMGMLLSNVGLIPGDSHVYDFLMNEGVNSAIVLILLSVNIQSIRQAGPEMLKAFGLGTLGSVIGALVMTLILRDSIGAETWKLAGQFAGTYIGGGVNFAALGREFETSSDLFSAAIAADVIVTSMWFVACLIAPILLTRSRKKVIAEPLLETSSSSLEKVLYKSRDSIHILQLGTLIAITLGTLGASSWLAGTIPVIPEILWLTTIVLLLGQLGYVKKLTGGAMMGNYLLLLFLAANGAKSVVANIIQVGPAVFYFAVGTIFIHGLIIFGLGTLLRINAGSLAVASQANVGGPSSAIAMASARGYGDKILPGIAVGLMGYAIGNYLGIAVALMIR